MRLLSLLALLAVASAAEAADKDDDAVKKVFHLMDSNFDDTVKEGFWLLEFFAPWCGHCKHLAPVLEETAKALDGTMKIAAIDATANSKLAKRFGVKGYPTVKFRMNSDRPVLPYKGKRTLDGFKDFAKRMTGPSVHKLESVETHDSFGTNESLWFLLGLPAGAEAKKLNDQFRKAALNFQDSLMFAEASSSDVLAKYNKNGAAFAAHVENTHGGGVEVTYYDLPDDHDPEHFEDWVRARRFPTLNKVGSHNFRELGHNTGKLFVVGVTDPTDAAKTGPFVEFMQRLSLPRTSSLDASVRDRYVFGHLDGTKWEKFVAQFNIVPEQFPRLFVLDAPDSKFYEDGDVKTMAEHEKFLNDVIAGNIPVQREGMWGLPTRIFNMLKRWWPYSILFAIPPVLLVYAFVQMCRDEEYEDERIVEEAEQEAEEKKKNK